MANCKHGPIKLRVDDYDDCVEVDAFIEFQSTSGVLHYYEIVAKPRTGSIERKVGDKMADLHFGQDSAKQLRKFLNELAEYRVELQ